MLKMQADGGCLKEKLVFLIIVRVDEMQTCLHHTNVILKIAFWNASRSHLASTSDRARARSPCVQLMNRSINQLKIFNYKYKMFQEFKRLLFIYRGMRVAHSSSSNLLWSKDIIIKFKWFHVSLYGKLNIF